MKQPLVTIIVPTIGRPQYIIDTILSVLHQTYFKLEVLISENYVEQSTREILSKHSIHDERIRIIGHSERLSFSRHLNICIAQSKGDYLMLLSDDDWIAPGYVEEMVTASIADESISICLGRQLTIGPDDYKMSSNKLIDTDTPVHTYSSESFFAQALLDGGLPTIRTFVCLFAPKKLIELVGGFADYPRGAHSDNILMMRLAACGNVFLGKSIYYYRVYNSSYGLSMSFSALVRGTELYLLDLSSCLSKSRLFSDFSLLMISLKVIYSNFLMIKGRYYSLYSEGENSVTKLTFGYFVLHYFLTTLPSPFCFFIKGTYPSLFHSFFRHCI